ncbi:MAG: PEP-CTERM sorting domain-containing protein [Planctomycetota bacterium]|jgi:subtilisin-like proprotein convertase family protein
MDARSTAQWTVAILITVVGACDAIVNANPVHLYGGEFDLPIPSPDESESEFGKGWMTDAVINVTDHIDISDLDVTVSLTHESLFDLQIIIQSPAGTNVLLNPAGNLAFIVKGEDGRLTPVGGSMDLFFDDEADVSIEQAIEPLTQPFRPVSSLSLFDHEDPFGHWRLRIYDAFYADTGTIDSFELIITTPEPTTAALLILGAALLTFFRPRRNN